MEIPNKCYAKVMFCAAVFVLLGSTFATFFVQQQIVSPKGTHCVGKSFYDVTKGKSSWNRRWKRFVYPPQSGDYGDVSCCDMSNAEKLRLQLKHFDAFIEIEKINLSKGLYSLSFFMSEALNVNPIIRLESVANFQVSSENDIWPPIEFNGEWKINET